MGGTPKILWPNGTVTRPNLSAEGQFGPRNSTAPGASKYHRGQDFWGIGKIRSIAAGTVVLVGWGTQVGWGGGYQVWIQHDGFFSRYLHMVDGSSPVRVGQKVAAGTYIGNEGMTGAYQVHLHLEITPGRWHTRNTGQVDPVAFIEARIEEDELSAEAERKIDRLLEIAEHMAFGKTGEWPDGPGGRTLREIRDKARATDKALASLVPIVEQLGDLRPGRPGEYNDYSGFEVIRNARNYARQAAVEAEASRAAQEALAKVVAEKTGASAKEILEVLRTETRSAVAKAMEGFEITLSAEGND